jgi:hypothetical protein
LILLLFSCLATSSNAEVIGPLLPKGAFEAGVFDQAIMREVYDGPDEFEWEQWTIMGVARWGITEFATVSVEASTNLVSFDSEFETPDYSYWVGGAIQAGLWHDERFTMSAAFQFTSTMLRFNEGSPRNANTKTAGGQLLVQHITRLWGAETSFWGGPAYSLFYSNLFREVGSSGETTELYTESNFGGVLGIGVLVAEHLNITGHVLWVENPQPRFGIVYRF